MSCPFKSTSAFAAQVDKSKILTPEGDPFESILKKEIQDFEKSISRESCDQTRADYSKAVGTGASVPNDIMTKYNQCTFSEISRKSFSLKQSQAILEWERQQTKSI